MKVQNKFVGVALMLLLLLYGPVYAHSGGAAPSAGAKQKGGPMQGSGSKQPMPMQGSGMQGSGMQGMGGGGKKSGGGMSGCNIDPETGWLGVEVVSLDKGAHPGIDHGIEVRSVISGGPGEKAGIQAGDILMSLDGKLLKSVDQMENSVMGFPIGYNAEVGVKRGNQDIKMVLKVEKRQSGVGMMPMMGGGMAGGGGGGMRGNMRPGMFMEDMMKRAPIGQMQQSGLSPGPSMMFGSGGLFGKGQSSGGTSSATEPYTETASARISQKYDVIAQYLFFEKDLKLSSGQVGALKKHKREIDKTLIRLDAAIKVAQIEMDELLNEDQVDMDKVEDKIREIEKYRTDRSLKQIRSITESKKILTKQQLENFQTLTSNF